MGIEYISIKGAAQRLGMTEDEVFDLINNKEVEYKTEYGITMITKASVYAYSGISPTGNQTKKKSKGGRPPATISFIDAGVTLQEDIRNLIEKDDLETYDNGDELHITKRSIEAYQKKLADAEVQELGEDVTDTDVGEMEEVGTLADEGTKTEEPYEYNDNFDMAEERELNSGRTPSEYNEPEHEPLVDFTDFTGMDDAVQETPSKELMEEETIIPLNEDAKYLKAKEDEVRLKAMSEKTVSGPDTITMKKDDFNAYLSIASMRAELQVYRSLKSFERR